MGCKPDKLVHNSKETIKNIAKLHVLKLIARSLVLQHVACPCDVIQHKACRFAITMAWTKSASMMHDQGR